MHRVRHPRQQPRDVLQGRGDIVQVQRAAPQAQGDRRGPEELRRPGRARRTKAGPAVLHLVPADHRTRPAHGGKEPRHDLKRFPRHDGPSPGAALRSWRPLSAGRQRKPMSTTAHQQPARPGTKKPRLGAVSSCFYPRVRLRWIVRWCEKRTRTQRGKGSISPLSCLGNFRYPQKYPQRKAGRRLRRPCSERPAARKAPSSLSGERP